MLTNIQKAQLSLVRKVYDHQRFLLDNFEEHHTMTFIDSCTNSCLGAISACASFHIYADMNSYDANFYNLLRERVVQLDCSLMRRLFRK